MVETPGKTSEELKGIVQAEKLDMKLPAKLDHKHQKMIDALNETKPDEFDKTYAGSKSRRTTKPLNCSMTMPTQATTPR
jgi:predicted outer membrane protein